MIIRITYISKLPHSQLQFLFQQRTLQDPRQAQNTGLDEQRDDWLYFLF